MVRQPVPLGSLTIPSISRRRYCLPSSQAHLVSLFGLAAGMGLLHLLLPKTGEPGGADDRQE